VLLFSLKRVLDNLIIAVATNECPFHSDLAPSRSLLLAIVSR
jgi:hypothetical protein